ncbi:uncharacterized protein DFL_003542 [Arthrobotrys flagrans]|uniref:DUF7137 domain-containing protein n=1 Tax=Arthrobotrys flagrans TaxID=97331 RepID=A0A437A245_ARTFL|nr:hypothetical protein DFL_003542 [Arthrobotrys flagrans]
MHLLKSFVLSSFFLLNISPYVLGSALDAGPNYRRQARETSEPAPASSASVPERTTSPARTTDSDTPASRSTGRSGASSSPTTRAKATFVDPRLPPGGVAIQTPITTINVEAFCSGNSQTYTIAQNLSIAKPSVIWDTGSFQPQNGQPPLAMGTYTLLIYDEKSAITAVPVAGNLAPFNGFKFGMYTPKAYTPLADFECPTCDTSSAAALDAVAIRMLVLFSTLFSLSFGLFFTFLP